MDPIFMVYIGLLGGSVGLSWLAERWRLLELMKGTAEALGSGQEAGSSWSLTRQHGEASVLVQASLAGGALQFRASVSSAPPIPPGLSVRRFPPGFDRELADDDECCEDDDSLEVYEERIGDELRLRGPASESLALLDKAVQTLFADASGDLGIELHGGVLSTEIKDSTLDVPRLTEHVERMIRLAGALALDPATIPARLALLASRGPAHHRRRVLWQLCGAYPAAPEADEAARRALSDPEPQVRLVAATHLREEGVPQLVELALGQSEPHIRAAAVDELARSGDRSRLEPLVARLLNDRTRTVALAAARSAGLLRLDSTIPQLAELLDSGDGYTAWVAASALGQLQADRAEAVLVRALERKDPSARLAAASALKVCGGPLALRALAPLRKRERFVSRTEQTFRAAVREAIEAIQGRLGPQEAGQLSLAELQDAEGNLSWPKDDGGLSIVPPEGRSS